jgi:creatinine amidohydrolase
MRRNMRWDESTYRQLESAAADDVVAVLPLGAVEAHGPHLPLGTDVWIAEAMAREGARRLRQAGRTVFVLPALAYAPAPFADGFAGTLSIGVETMAALVEDLAAALARRGVAVLALASAHFDPAQVATLRGVVARRRGAGPPRLVHPDLTQRDLARRLGEEFASGACHGGRFETSILLAERPELVDRAAAAALAAVAIALPAAARAGHTTFEAAGLGQAYCGDPSRATAEEGRELVARLGEILAEAVASE